MFYDLEVIKNKNIIEKENIMAGTNKRKRNGWKTLSIVLTIALVFGVSIFYGKDYLVAQAEEKVEDAVIQNVLENVISSDNQAAADAAQMAKDIYSSMSEEDKDSCRDLVSSNLTRENLANATKYVKNGDLSGLKSYVKSNVSETDKDTIKTLYYKYRDQLDYPY